MAVALTCRVKQKQDLHQKLAKVIAKHGFFEGLKKSFHQKLANDIELYLMNEWIQEIHDELHSHH